MKRDDELEFLFKELTGLDVVVYAPGKDFPAEINCVMGNLNSIRTFLKEEEKQNKALSEDGFFYVEENDILKGIAVIKPEALDGMRNALKEKYSPPQPGVF
jgi:hypothetical protein